MIALCARSDDNPGGSHYWVKTTKDFGNKDTVWFGDDMRGVRNPIVTSFAAWPVCKQFILTACVLLYRVAQKLATAPCV